MIYVLAAIGAITVAVLFWRAFGPNRDTPESTGSSRAPVAPDDDPEFLRRLREQQRKQGNSGEDSDG
jgi:hypothetical protein